MAEATVEIDGEEVTVRKTDEGYEVEEQVDEGEAVQRFADAHPCVNSFHPASGHSAADYIARATMKDIEPGRGNFGTGRTGAEREHIADNGLELGIAYIEPKFNSGEWTIGLTIDDA